MHLSTFSNAVLYVFLAFSLFGCSSQSIGSEFVKLTEKNWDEFVPQGKEVDAIYGDYVLRNDRIVVIIAKPSPIRNANLTIRDVGGYVLDLTSRNEQNDQLGCYFPLAGKFHFHSTEKISIVVDGQDTSTGDTKGKTITVNIASSTGPSGQKAILSYTLKDGAAWLKIDHQITSGNKQLSSKTFTDSIRADRSFQFSIDKSNQLFMANDDYFRQCYGIRIPSGKIAKGNGRAALIHFSPEKESTTRYLTSGSSKLSVLGLHAQASGTAVAPVTVNVEDPRGGVRNAIVEILNGTGSMLGSARTGARGDVEFALPNGTYTATVDSIGQTKQTRRFGVLNQRVVNIRVKQESAPPIVSAKITGEDGGSIPCKVAFYGRNATADPNYGPDSAANPVKNLFYSHNGEFDLDIEPGEYDVIVSRGPEYDAEFMTIKTKAGEVTKVSATLKRVVKTKGWVSTEYHSHSSPSGDNTSDQFGRVLNLLGEHLEFAPCTEHQRIDTYVPHIRRLNAEKWLATCSGMELTGNPLPLNHQNVFPLVHKPRTQDGGGPRIDPNPVVQIERIAYWDNKSEKVVQSNHPNLIQMAGDANLDGVADNGFKKMFDFMDVMEVHPPQGIFNKPDSLPVRGKRGNVIFNWMQLLNQGYRIIGVVNTDSHYNYHGSGWLRNFVKSSTDDAGKIDTMEMVRNTKAGKVVMSTGPFMEVSLTPSMSEQKVVFGPGDDALVKSGKVILSVKVQCPNWLDVNRVQVFVNGNALPELNFTRRGNPNDFKNGIVKFEKSIPVELSGDSHIIVATLGEGLKLGRVMGPNFGNNPPCAVANPIFVDVDGNGFQANGEKIGSPFLFKK